MEEHGQAGGSPVDLARQLASAWGSMSGDEQRQAAATLTQAGFASAMDPASMAPAPQAGQGGVEELTRRLQELSAMLSPEERNQVESRLRESGMFRLPSGSGGSFSLSAADSEFFREFFEAQPGVELDGGRLAHLAAVLAAFTSSLEQLSWPTWKRIAPRSELRRGEPLGRLIAEYAAGRTEDLDAIRDETERLKQLLGSLVQSISQFGKIAHSKLQDLDPALIEASMTGKGDQACWKRYKEIVGAFDEDELEADLLAKLADSSESMMRDVVKK